MLSVSSISLCGFFCLPLGRLWRSKSERFEQRQHFTHSSVRAHRQPWTFRLLPFPAGVKRTTAIQKREPAFIESVTIRRLERKGAQQKRQNKNCRGGGGSKATQNDWGGGWMGRASKKRPQTGTQTNLYFYYCGKYCRFTSPLAGGHNKFPFKIRSF